MQILRKLAGPRTLGHRSFLCRGDKENIRKILNDIKSREWFRPLAGMFTEATAEEIFESQIKYSYYMNTSATIKEEYVTTYEGLSHVDRSTRPQILNQNLCADTHELMSSLFERTKCLGCVNTSSISKNHWSKPQSKPLLIFYELRQSSLFTIRQISVTKNI